MEVAARAPRSGLGQQGLHCDVATREGRAMTALVYLDDADAQNGGTHRWWQPDPRWVGRRKFVIRETKVCARGHRSVIPKRTSAQYPPAKIAVWRRNPPNPE
jgi:hypothetical protein